MAFVVLLAVFLTLWNNLINRWSAFQRWYVPINLGLAALLLLPARWRGLSWQALGFAAEGVGGGLAWGLAAVLVVALVVALVFAWPRTRPLLRDRRIAHLEAAGLAFMALVRIPLGTVVLEEVAFRGVLLGAWAHHRSVVAAVIGSSVVFGLWHILPTIILYDLGHQGASLRARLTAAAVGVGFTTIAGVLLCLLRLASGSLLAPVMAHCAANSLGALAGFAAHRSDRPGRLPPR